MARTRSGTATAANSVSASSHVGNPEAKVVEGSSPSPSDSKSINFKDNLQCFRYQTSGSYGGRHDTARHQGSKDAAINDSPETKANLRKRPLQDVDTGTSMTTSRTTQSPSPAKRKRESSRYAPPSKYAHLSKLVDILEPHLICVFVGTNPGIRTATAGHAYAHPSNMFWKLLHSSGCTDRRCRPEEDVDLPRLYAMGNTNIVERPTKDAAELSKAEMAQGTPILEAKIRQFKPEAVCIVGKGIWEAIWRYKHGKNPSKDEFHWGWQEATENMGRTSMLLKEEDAHDHDCQWNGAKVYVTSSTSGLSASLKPPEKEAIWKPFGEWVKMRREQRASGESEQRD